MIGRRNLSFRPCGCHMNSGEEHRFDETLVCQSCGQDWEAHQEGVGVACDSQEESNVRERRSTGT